MSKNVIPGTLKKDTGSIKERHSIPWNTSRGYVILEYKEGY